MKTLPIIRILAPDIYEKDAVGNFCIDLHLLLKTKGIASQLYAQHFEENSVEILRLEMFFEQIRDDDLVFCSYSIFDPFLERVLQLPNQKWCYFHGVTPAELLEEFEAETAALCQKSVEQFSLLRSFDRLYANSKYTAEYLQTFVGQKEIAVYPPLFPTRRFSAISDIASIDFSNKQFLVVGRIVPHKKIEDALKVFKKIHTLWSNSHLAIIGEAPNHTYNMYLNECVENLDLAQHVHFVGKVSEEELKGYYASGFAVINASMHEGFGIPILEALHYGLIPIIRRGNAMEEVAGEYGVLFGDDLIFTSNIPDSIVLHSKRQHYAALKANESLKLIQEIEIYLKEKK